MYFQVFDPKLDLWPGRFVSSVHLLLLLQHRSLDLQHGAHCHQPGRQNRPSDSVSHSVHQTILDHGRRQLGDFFFDDASALDGSLGKAGIRTKDFQLHDPEEKWILSDDFLNFRRISFSFRRHCDLLHFHFPKGEDDWQKSDRKSGQIPKQRSLSTANSQKWNSNGENCSDDQPELRRMFPARIFADGRRSDAALRRLSRDQFYKPFYICRLQA